MAGTIKVEGLAKKFRKWEPNEPMTLQEVVLRGLRRKRREWFWALTDVSFQVNPGRMVGIMGFNGAGKSTLLRLVAGVGAPTQGRITIKGRVGAILDLGVGFNPELTGRENIFVSGVCSGLTREEVRQRFDSIVAFSELEEFLDFPLRTYSSGMHVRLAFAVASHIEPEVLLVDEVLAVGDLAFQKKCMDRMKSFKRSGCTGLIVSHSPQAILTMCDDAIWLDHGRVVAFGRAEEVVGQYVEATGVMPKKPEPSPPPTPSAEMATLSSTLESRGDPTTSAEPVEATTAAAEGPDTAS